MGTEKVQSKGRKNVFNGKKKKISPRERGSHPDRYKRHLEYQIDKTEKERWHDILQLNY